MNYIRHIGVFVLALMSTALYAQTVSGTVTDENNQPLPGATILVQGTNTGTTTDFDGNYQISATQGQTLVFSYVGYTTQNVVVNSAAHNVSLQIDNALDEVVVSGVAGATSRKKLSVSVATVNSEDIAKVPAGSASSALLGKVAGVSIANLGRPGQGSTIILRGAANFFGSQEPLVILDGVFVEGGLGDINVDDIASYEIVKGASASSLYGSRAGNGVIVIQSKRGKVGKTEVTFRTESGFNKLTNFIQTNQSHGWELASDWEQFKGKYTKLEGINYPANFQSVYAAGGDQAVSGARIESTDNFSDNPYGVYNDFQDLLFKSGTTSTNYISVSSGSEKTQSLFSFENYKNEGVLAETRGYFRNSIRANIDFNISEKLRFSASNVYVTLKDYLPGGDDDTFRLITRLSPDSNLTFTNPDGQPYWYKPDPHDSEIDNPLYEVYAEDVYTKQNRFLGGYNLRYNLSSDLNVELEYSFENNNYTYVDYDKYSTYNDDGSKLGFGYTEGGLRKFIYSDLSQKAQATINFAKELNEFELKAKLSYLAEDREYEETDITAQDFLYEGLPSFDVFTPEDVFANSDQESIRAQNIFAIAGITYKDRYILDGLFRSDGSTLFGENNRWNNYYRISAAYRITQDFDIPGFQELKFNVAHGTSGQRPGYEWQYEVTEIEDGKLSTDRYKGNPDLKPSLTTETEFGLTGSFLDRFNLEAVYSSQLTTDQFMEAPLFSPANAGKNRQWQNVGDLEAKTIEISLNSTVLDSEKFKWNLGLNFSKTTNQILKLNVGDQQVGPDALFLLKENEEFGGMWGRVFVKDLKTMEAQLPSGDVISDYSVNSDGMVVKTSTIGTANEAAIIKVDENGTPVFEQIGNQNPDFRVGMTSNFSYKNIDFYMLWDWKQGGDVYNRNAQWNTISERNAIVDQAGKPDNLKKTRKYYGSLYDVNQNNGYWVEDGTYVKLRELAVTYNFNDEVLRKTKLIKDAKLSLIGRNLLTFTKYQGWDPEVTKYNSRTQQYFAVDYGVYPTQTSYTLSLQLKF